ncbi:VOC family protein [Falsibacillus albus]|uniref:VOC family protein n=1 Tax=Falsibacillus albus TaxID=2478915 RepID=A0A3L7JSW2_9BACI|nr:VOC family protein [Falsibacillus albus]RLQ93355.1 VOC family protein [Falsibacillus albus]
MHKGLHHVVIFSKDPDASAEWYRKAGFEYIRGYDRMHWFQLGDGEIMIHPSDEVSPGKTAIHVAVENVDVLFHRVMHEGLDPVDHQEGGNKIAKPVVREWGDKEFELVDPDGHKWAFTEI